MSNLKGISKINNNDEENRGLVENIYHYLWTKDPFLGIGILKKIKREYSKENLKLIISL